MLETELWTYQDAVEHLRDRFDIDAAGHPYRNARRAVLNAYRDLPFRSRWSYFNRRSTLKTSASQSTGTITYDHTGGSSELLLTLTGATWPSWADFGRVIIADVHYDVATRVSDTVVTLSPNNNPGADVAALTTYQIFRGSYPLPVNFRKMGRVFDVDNEHEIAITVPDLQHAQSIYYYDTPDTPWSCAIGNQGEYFGSLSIIFSPPPSAAKTYDFMFEAKPRDLNVEKEVSGTVSITAGATAVSATGGAFTSDHVGSVIRFSTSTTVLPVSRVGGIDSDSQLYTAQRIITAVTDGNNLTVDSTVTNALSGVKYTISDPLDLEAGAMFTAFQRLSEAEWARLQGHEDRTELMAAAIYAIKDAKENDQRSTVAQAGIRYDKFSRAKPTTDV